MSSVAAMGLYRSGDSFSGKDRKAFITFKGCMETKIALAGTGTAERPFNLLFWFNDVEKQLSESARDSFVAARARILSMKKFCRTRRWGFGQG